MGDNKNILLKTFVNLLLEQYHKDPEINKFFKELEIFRAMVTAVSYKDMSSTQQDYFLNLGNDIWTMVIQAGMKPSDAILHTAQNRLNRLKQDVNMILGYVLFPDVNKKATKLPTPEAPKNAPYGHYLFAQNRDDIKYKVNSYSGDHLLL